MGDSNNLIVSSDPRPRIMSIQFGLLMRGVEAIPNNTDIPNTFQILDQKITLKDDAKNKKYVREVVTQTVALRNGYGLMESL